MPCHPDQPLQDLKSPYLQAQQALGHNILAVQLLDLLTFSVHLQLLGVDTDQGQPALGHAFLAEQPFNLTHPLLQADDTDLASSHML